MCPSRLREHQWAASGCRVHHMLAVSALRCWPEIDGGYSVPDSTTSVGQDRLCTMVRSMIPHCNLVHKPDRRLHIVRDHRSGLRTEDCNGRLLIVYKECFEGDWISKPLVAGVSADTHLSFLTLVSRLCLDQTDHH